MSSNTPSRPCQQLNSSVIRAELQSNIIPLVEEKCSVIGTKSVWRLQGGKTGIIQGWNEIVTKRNECDSAIARLNGVSFFVSAISTYESKLKASKPNNEEERELMDANSEEDEIESSQNIPQLSMDSNQCAREASDKRRHPAITYWIALQSANGAPVSPRIVQSALLNCNVEAHPTRAANKSSKSSDLLNKICQAVKDHKNNYMYDLVHDSYSNCFRQLSEQLIGKPLENYGYNEQVVRFTMVKATPVLSHALKRLKDKGLQMDIFGLPTTEQESTNISTTVKPLGDELTVLCNDVERALAKLHYAIHKGDVYKLVKDAKYTYQRLCAIDEFLHSLLGNDYFKQRLLRNMPKLLTILKHPECEAIRQIQVDNDIVEVNDNWFWSFQENAFKKDVLNNCPQGVISPRAFISYDHDTNPDPLYFKEIIENSLDEEQKVSFCRDFLGLFRVNSREHKDKVPCLIGPSNSGKTSILLATTKIIDQSKVARVLKQREFNKSMINQETQLINLDEAVTSLMDVDDWKTLLQGGLTAHDVKYRNAKTFVNRAPVFISAQKDLTFGCKADNEAMENRLTKYLFKALPQVVPEAATWLRDNPMHCIVWAAAIVKRHEANHPTRRNEELDLPGLSSEERLHIFKLKMSDETPPSPVSDEDIGETDASASDEEIEESESEPDDTQLSERVGRLQDEKMLCVAEVNFGKGRMIDRMIVLLEEEKDEMRKQRRKSNESLRERKKNWLKDLGVDGDLISQQLPRNADLPLPSQLQREASKCACKNKEKQDEREREKTKQSFGSGWLKSQEKKMRELQEDLEKCTDAKTKMAKQYLIETTSDAIKLYHQQRGTMQDLGVKLRQQFCFAWGLISLSGRKRIHDLHSPLPQEDEDGNYKGLSKRKRKVSVTSSQPDGSQVKITKYFSSQR